MQGTFCCRRSTYYLFNCQTAKSSQFRTTSRLDDQTVPPGQINGESRDSRLQKYFTYRMLLLNRQCQFQIPTNELELPYPPTVDFFQFIEVLPTVVLPNSRIVTEEGNLKNVETFQLFCWTCFPFTTLYRRLDIRYKTHDEKGQVADLRVKQNPYVLHAHQNHVKNLPNIHESWGQPDGLCRKEKWPRRHLWERKL